MDSTTPTAQEPVHEVDRLGALASALCAVHCAVCALIPGALAALGLTALGGHELEWGFTIAAVAFALLAVVTGWRRHRSYGVLSLLVAGVAGLVVARLAEEAGLVGYGTLVGVLAGGLLIAGHVSGIRATRRCQDAACAAVCEPAQ